MADKSGVRIKTRNDKIIVMILVLLWGSIFPRIHVEAQDLRPYESSVKKLIVYVADKSADSEFGAGIIVSIQSDSLYIITANHVVEQYVANIGVAFEFLTENFIDRVQQLQKENLVHAERLDTPDLFELDVAVLRVNLQEFDRYDIHVSLPFQHLQKPLPLARGTDIYIIGHPGGDVWNVSPRSMKISSIMKNEITSDGICLPGHSGGGVFSMEGKLVGMNKDGGSLLCRALSFEQIRQKLQEKGIIVSEEPYPINIPPIQLPLSTSQNFVGGKTWYVDINTEEATEPAFMLGITGFIEIKDFIGIKNKLGILGTFMTGSFNGKYLDETKWKTSMIDGNLVFVYLFKSFKVGGGLGYSRVAFDYDTDTTDPKTDNRIGPIIYADVGDNFGSLPVGWYGRTSWMLKDFNSDAEHYLVEGGISFEYKRVTLRLGGIYKDYYRYSGDVSLRGVNVELGLYLGK